MKPRHTAEYWLKYNSNQDSRKLRELYLQASELAGHEEGRLALDIGAGMGRETAAMIARGWHVLAVDQSRTLVSDPYRPKINVSEIYSFTRHPSNDFRARGLPRNLKARSVSESRLTVECLSTHVAMTF